MKRVVLIVDIEVGQLSVPLLDAVARGAKFGIAGQLGLHVNEVDVTESIVTDPAFEQVQIRNARVPQAWLTISG